MMEDLQPIRAAARSFETARLLLRPYEPGDLDAMAEMFGDAEVTAHTLLGRRDRAQTSAVLDGYRGFLAERGYGMLAILDRETGQYFGEVGLFVSPMGPLALRYALARPAWGKGIATEASAAVLNDSFDDLGLHRVFAGVTAENGASLRVMDKLGFVFREVVSAGGKTFNLFELTRDDWKARSR
jgi:[ribosomal protein S5]-alanine N-acetyltransferase